MAMAMWPFGRLQMLQLRFLIIIVIPKGQVILFCTVGHSGDGKNVALWDTLMPQRRCLVESYTFHDSGASALLFAPQHSQLGSYYNSTLWSSDFGSSKTEVIFYKTSNREFILIYFSNGG